MGLQLAVLRAGAETDFDAAFAALTKLRADGLVISNDELFASRSAQLAGLAARRGIPAIFEHRVFTAAGGLMSYGSNFTETYHQFGVYSGLILKGAKPADLPVYQSPQVECIINRKAATSFGFAVPLALPGCAKEVIE